MFFSLQRLNEAVFPQEQGQLQTPFFAPLRGTRRRPSASSEDARPPSMAALFRRNPFPAQAGRPPPPASNSASPTPPTPPPKAPAAIICQNPSPSDPPCKGLGGLCQIRHNRAL